jgi:hypothetical protein
MSVTSATLLTVVVLVTGQLVLFGLSLIALLRWRVPADVVERLLRASALTLQRRFRPDPPASGR